MINSAAGYLSSLTLLAGALVWLSTRFTHWRVFRWLPPVVMTYLLVMVLANFGLWSGSEAQSAVYAHVKQWLVPAMIVLMLLPCQLHKVWALGPKLLAAFFLASTGIMLGCVVAYLLFQPLLASAAWKTFAALSGSWLGGTANMVAVQVALDVQPTEVGYALLIDSVDYSLWLMFLLALVPQAARFNGWSGAAQHTLSSLEEETDRPIAPASDGSLLLLVALVLAVAQLANMLGASLGGNGFLSADVVRILAVTGFGLGLAYSPLARLAGSAAVASALLYLLIAVIASRASLAELSLAPLYVLAGLVVLLVHGLIMLVAAKWLKLDLFTCGVASLANIGGVASAPILAATYARALVPVGVLMALMGYVIGTGGGLLVGRILMWLA